MKRHIKYAVTGTLIILSYLAFLGVVIIIERLFTGAGIGIMILLVGYFIGRIKELI